MAKQAISWYLGRASNRRREWVLAREKFWRSEDFESNLANGISSRFRNIWGSGEKIINGMRFFIQMRGEVGQEIDRFGIAIHDLETKVSAMVETSIAH